MPARQRQRYTDQFRRQTVVEYLLIGTVKGTARKVGIDPSTLRSWMKSEWWGNLEEEMRAERATNPTAQALADRLDKVAEDLITKFEQDDTQSKLQPREISFAIEKILKARNLERGDPNARAKELENMRPEELAALQAQLEREISEAEKQFGESAYRPEEDDGSDETGGRESDPASESEGSPSTAA